MVGRENMACRFVFDGEGVRFVRGVAGVWIAGKGAVESEVGGTSLLVGFADAWDTPFCVVLDEREAGLRCVTKRWTI
jgi:hypothetical protein